MDLTTLNGSSVALLMMTRTSTDNKYVVLHGKAYWTGSQLLLDPGQGVSTITLPPTAVSRLEPMDDEAEEVVGSADFWTWVMVGHGLSGDISAAAQMGEA